MVKRAITSKSRGSPPLPRQRRALRLLQATLVVVGFVLATLSFDAYSARTYGVPALWISGPDSPSLPEIVSLGTAAALSFGGAAAMGLRVVRGPEPPELD